MKLKLILTSNVMDAILENYRDVIGNNFQQYRGHCYRLLNYMLSLGLEGEEIRICEYAIPFHDIGIWTAETMDYLEPSCQEAEAYLKNNNIDIDAILVSEIINNHHKISKVKGNNLAELLRKADLIDLLNGKISYKIPKDRMKLISQRFPSHGFQKMIFGKVIKHAIRNVLNPFPMLKI